MKTHKIKFGGEFTINGYDDTFRTFCGITEECSESMHDGDYFVGEHDQCTCKNCNKSYRKYYKQYNFKIR